MRTSIRYKLTFFIFIISVVLIVGLPQSVSANGNTFIVSNDLIKNFKFESFDGRSVSQSGQTLAKDLQFESQASWNIYPDDISLLDIYTDGDNAYIRYKVAMTSKVNMYTTLDVVDCAQDGQLKQVSDTYLVAKYQHLGLFGDVMHGWEESVTWNHYDFGNIKQWNSANNDYDGDLVMSFDIAQNLLPNFQTVSGDSLLKNFDYIAVSSVAVVDNTYGKLDSSVPTVVGITPRDYEEEYSSMQNPTSAIKSKIASATRMFDAYYDPNIRLNIPTTPQNSWDGGITPQSAGSSMNPTTKTGDPIWNPETKQTSMKDCKCIYHIGSLSPLVTEYYGTLSFKYIFYRSIDYWDTLLHIGIKEYSKVPNDQSYTKPVALHCTNRYIQTTIRVVFDVFCSYKIDVGSDSIEDYNLDFPEEYYDLLLWLTTVDGFGGGETHTAEAGGLFGDYTTWIIIIAIVAVGILVLVFVVMPILKARQSRKMVESIVKKR
ncbi:MAG: hypothetical protein ACFFCV_05980 [Promethearchaeota archaeon]